MKHWTVASAQEMLAPFAFNRALLAFDFDGTLAPIVDDPEQAEMRTSTSALLKRLAKLYPCAVISGRARRDLLPRIAAIDLAYAIGNHGAEWGDGEDDSVEPLRALVRTCHEKLAQVLADREGMTIEDKGLSLTVHVHGKVFDGAEEIVGRAIQSIGDLRIYGGRRSVNIVPADAPHKGTALSRMVANLGCRAALYVGDDTTDEDAFVNPGVEHFLSLRVGASDTSKAAYYLEHQREIDPLIEALLDLLEAA